jgi:4-amino-4-deoxy-L-arabinose transferase-like glycosyltransferase
VRRSADKELRPSSDRRKHSIHSRPFSLIVTPRRSLALGIVLAVAFFGAGFIGLGRRPLVHEDEPWQAVPGYTFWGSGRFASDLFAGFGGSEKHVFLFPPVSPLLVGASLRLAGPSLAAARVVPLLFVAFALVLTERLGTRLFSPRAGLLGALLLALVPVARTSELLGTGIPLADVARIARYDAVVPALGLASLLVALVRSPGRRGVLSPLLSGVLAGLATLTHLYGAVWLAICALSTFSAFSAGAAPPGRRGRFRLLLGAGFLLALAPYALFVASGWDDFRAQTRSYGSRFDLLSPGFFLTNLLAERHRFSGVTGALRDGRPGAWLFLAALVAGVLLLVRDSRRGDRRALVLPSGLAFAGVSFALLLEQKNPLYLATVWPLAALVAAAGFERLAANARPAARALLVLVLLVALLDGARARLVAARAAFATTPYDALASTLRQRVPPGCRVTGLPQWALAFLGTSVSYRTILVPAQLAHPAYVETPVPVGEGLDRLAPDFVLVDPRLRAFLEGAASEGSETRPIAEGMRAWLEHRGARTVTSIDDPSYGRLSLVAVTAPGRTPASTP